MTTPADYSAFQVAGTVEPLPTSGGNSLLQDADRALFFALDFWKFIIRQYVGARLLQAVAAAGMATGSRQDPIRNAVAQDYPWPPDLELQSNQYKFPLLAVYRKTSTYRRKTASWEHDRCTIDLLYVLPPMTAGQTEQIYPVFRAIAMAIRHKTTQGWDPAYTPPGGNLGDQPWALPYAAVEEIGFDGDTYGTFPDTGNLKFPFLQMSGYIIERDNYLPGTKFAGGDISTSLVADDQTSIPNFMAASTQQAPTIASVSPSGGPIAGGTSVTLTGALFLPAPMVLFGNTPALNVVQVNATTITCTSPAVSGSGVLGVVVVNRDGQVGTLPASFTYS